jgi:hypothetical protein
VLRAMPMARITALTPAPSRLCLDRRKPTPSALVKHRSKRLKALAYG